MAVMNLFEQQSSEFTTRHIGPNEDETKQMLQIIGAESISDLIEKTVPPSIRTSKSLNLPAPMNEHEYLKYIKEISLKNKE